MSCVWFVIDVRTLFALWFVPSNKHEMTLLLGIKLKRVRVRMNKNPMDDCKMYTLITTDVNWPTVQSNKSLLYSSHISVLPHPQSVSIRLGTQAVFSPTGQAGARESPVGKPPTSPPRQTNHKQTRRGPRHQYNHRPQPRSLPQSAGCLYDC